MLKLSPFEIPPHIHLDRRRRMYGKIHTHRLCDNHQHIEHDKRPQAIQRVFHDKMVDGIALK